MLGARYIQLLVSSDISELLSAYLTESEVIYTERRLVGTRPKYECVCMKEHEIQYRQWGKSDRKESNCARSLNKPWPSMLIERLGTSTFANNSSMHLDSLGSSSIFYIHNDDQVDVMFQLTCLFTTNPLQYTRDAMTARTNIPCLYFKGVDGCHTRT